jgi:hypothetical protein
MARLTHQSARERPTREVSQRAEQEIRQLPSYNRTHTHNTDTHQRITVQADDVSKSRSNARGEGRIGVLNEYEE